MKRYRIEFAGSPLGAVIDVVLVTVACLTILLIPAVLAYIPTLYEIVQVEE